MKALLQRVKYARVKVGSEVTGEIGPGLLILLGVADGDGEREAEFLADKCANLRIFEDDAGKMNRSVLDTGGGVLVVSQFTLCGDASHGRRPSYSSAAPPEIAEKLYLQEADVAGVVSFYNYFTTKPKGKYCINVCLGTACYVKGSEKVLSEIERVLGIKADTDPTPDGLFSISALRCVGACGLAPVMMVNDKVYGKVTPAKAVEIINEYKQRG